MTTTRLVSVVWVLWVVGCTKETPPPPAPVHAATPVDPKVVRQVRLTFLVTGAENGYPLPTPDEGQVRGGAAEILGRWVATEGHCAGPLGANGDAACKDAETVVLSTGDNGNGQAISSAFHGEPTAELMKYMGYAASAFGNRELDWPREQFAKNAAAGGFPYLAANLEATDEEGKKLGLTGSRLLTRKGAKVGIIGLSSHKATLTPMPGRMAGMRWKKDEEALAAEIPALVKSGANAVVVVTDGCLNDMPPMLEAHPEWKLAFVAGRKCEEPYPDHVGATKFLYPGRHWNSYVKALVTLDLAKPAAEQLMAVEASSVDVLNQGGPPADRGAAQLVAAWKTKLDATFGETIGFTKVGFEQESAEMSAWLTTALRDRFKTDVALINRKGVRQGLLAGAITKASIYDLFPFENHVVVVKVSGEALMSVLGNVQARVAGVKPKGDGFVDAAGKPIDPKKTYTLATADYLYLGGDGFELHKADPNPTQTSVAVQTALIEWTSAKKSTEKQPLEAMVKVK